MTDKEYTYRRKGIVVATVTKHADGSATLESAVRHTTFPKANSAFAAVNGWLMEMDGCNGFSDIGGAR